KDGVEHIVVDAKGQRKEDVETIELVGGQRRIDPEPGDDVVTTLDLDLQEIVEEALKKHRSAAAAVVEVETGRLLALGSWPEPDPNSLTGRLSHADSERLTTDPTRPLIDKTLRENYFPGSTFKIVPTLAALAENLIDPNEHVFCHGAIRFGRRTF